MDETNNKHIQDDINILEEKHENETYVITSTDINNITIKDDNDDDNVDYNSKEHQMKMMYKKQAKKEKKLQKKQIKYYDNKEKLCNTFRGKHKWLGGAVDPKTGKIYGIPSHSYQIICITPSSSTSKAEISTIPLPNEYQEGHYKWLRGLIHNGYLYGIPAWNVKGILKVNLHPPSKGNIRNNIQVLPLPHSPCYYMTNPVEHKEENEKNSHNESVTSRNHSRFSNIDRGRWMWHGGTVGKCSDNENDNDTKAAIYCIPSNAKHVLKVYLDESDKVEEIGPPLSEGQNKWYGGILGVDGCVYGMPYTATGVLRINPKTDSVEVLGDFPSGGYKWHGKRYYSIHVYKSIYK